MRTRVDFKDFITAIERDFPVNSWKADGIHLWPIIRIRLFFFLLQKFEFRQIKTSASAGNPASLLKRAKRHLRGLADMLYYFKWLGALSAKKNVYVGFDAHRVDYNGKRYNKFFDPLIGKERSIKHSTVFEFGDETITNQQHPEIVMRYQRALAGFLNYQKQRSHAFTVELDGLDAFIEFIRSNPDTSEFAPHISRSKLQVLARDLYLRVTFFEKVLQRIKPEQVMFLCYYSNLDELAMIAAANRLGIKTIEMQHGPQTEIHLCYGNWSAVPPSGYDVMPRQFWCWDPQSSATIEKWAANTAHTSFVGGNPWIDHWKSKSSDYHSNGFILYSLQPKPVTIEELFPDKIIELIKASAEKWFLRLHPRQFGDRQNIMALLESKGVLSNVDIDSATNDPLPQLLANAKLHLTHFSGTAIEAAFFDVFTILLSEKAILSFPDLIAESKAEYLDVHSSGFTQRFLQILEAQKA